MTLLLRGVFRSLHSEMTLAIPQLECMSKQCFMLLVACFPCCFSCVGFLYFEAKKKHLDPSRFLKANSKTSWHPQISVSVYVF